MGKKKDKKNKKEKKAKKLVDPIPSVAYIELDQDCYWNAIPLGLTANEDGDVLPVYWYLNDQNLHSDDYNTIPSTSFLVAGGTGSGKTVLELGILSHLTKYPDMFQVVGIDCKRVEFTSPKLKSQFNAVLKDAQSAASAIETARSILMQRFKMMEKYQVNNVYKVAQKDVDVDYYEFNCQKYQFDEILEVEVDLDENARDYARQKSNYPEGKRPLALTIETVYNDLNTGAKYYVNGQPITAKSIKKTSGTYNPKVVMLMIDELNELMCSDDYKSVDIIKTGLGSIARLGRAAGVHLVLGCQRASGSTISSDLKNNIQLCCLLGGFDDTASSLMFEKDVSNYCKPQIKGRGFISSGTEIIETQIYGGEYRRFL